MDDRVKWGKYGVLYEYTVGLWKEPQYVLYEDSESLLVEFCCLQEYSIGQILCESFTLSGLEPKKLLSGF